MQRRLRDCPPLAQRTTGSHGRRLPGRLPVSKTDVVCSRATAARGPRDGADRRRSASRRCILVVLRSSNRRRRGRRLRAHGVVRQVNKSISNFLLLTLISFSSVGHAPTPATESSVQLDPLLWKLQRDLRQSVLSNGRFRQSLKTLLFHTAA